MRKILPACFLALLAGCCATRNRSEVCYTASRSVSPPAGIVFVANGSGDFRTLSANLDQAVAEGSVPLQIETFVWSHGYGRYLADHVDHANHLAEGRRLAVQVAGYRQAWPGRRVYGPEDLPELWAELEETYAEYTVEPVEFFESGDCVVVAVHISARLRASDDRIDGLTWQVWRLSDVLVTEVRVYTDRSEAFRSAEQPDR